jgi:RecB family endonuclease NucS
MIGKLVSVDIRKISKHEEHDFSVCLEQNIHFLNESIEIKLSPLQKEKKAGPFQVDLVAEDPNGDLVIIENQLKHSNHDHLGKLLTYMTNLEAKTAIRVVSNAQSEHITAMNWLNDKTPPEMFFYF